MLVASETQRVLVGAEAARGLRAMFLGPLGVWGLALCGPGPATIAMARLIVPKAKRGGFLLSF